MLTYRLVTGPNYLLLPTHAFYIDAGSCVDHASGGVGGVMASLTTMVEECWGSSFLIIPSWASHNTKLNEINSVNWIPNIVHLALHGFFA